VDGVAVVPLRLGGSIEQESVVTSILNCCNAPPSAESEKSVRAIPAKALVSSR
jgi:hypothetical protein